MRVAGTFFRQYTVFLLLFCTFSVYAQEQNPFIQDVENSYGYFGAPAWSPDGRYFASVYDGRIALYDSETLSLIKSFDSYSGENEKATFNSIEFSSNSKKILAVKSDGTIILYDTETSAPYDVIDSKKCEAENAVFGSGDYELILPYDGKNLYEYFRLVASENYILNKKISVGRKIVSLSRSENSSLVLAADSSGKMYLVLPLKDGWQKLGEYDWNTRAGIFPKISGRGNAFLSASSLEDLSVAFLAGSSAQKVPEVMRIYEKTGFSGDACLSYDGKYVAFATGDRKIKVYDTYSGNLLKVLGLGTTESYSAGAFSPSGDELLFTTKKGTLYRWQWKIDTSGLELPSSPPKLVSASINNDSNLTAIVGSSTAANGADVSGVKLPFIVDYRTKNGIFAELQLEFMSMPEPYNYALAADFNVINYDLLKPFFTGLRLRPFLGVPGEDFPYRYTLNGELLESPCLAGAGLCVPFGIFMMPFGQRDIGISAEISAGGNFSFLWNRKTGAEFKRSDFFKSFVVATRLGFYWKVLNLFAGVFWDSILKLNINAGAGVSLRLGGKK